MNTEYPEENKFELLELYALKLSESLSNNESIEEFLVYESQHYGCEVAISWSGSNLMAYDPCKDFKELNFDTVISAQAWLGRKLAFQNNYLKRIERLKVQGEAQCLDHSAIRKEMSVALESNRGIIGWETPQYVFHIEVGEDNQGNIRVENQFLVNPEDFAA